MMLRSSAALAAPQADGLGPNGRVRLEAGDDLDRDGVTEEPLDVAQHRPLVDADE